MQVDGKEICEEKGDRDLASFERIYYQPEEGSYLPETKLFKSKLWLLSSFLGLEIFIYFKLRWT